MSFWKKAWEKIKKYWQLIIGFFALLFVLVRMKMQQRKQKKVLQNEIETTKRINEIEKTHDEKVDTAIKNAEKNHKSRVEEANKNLETKIEDAKKELDDRIEENETLTLDELADRIASTLDVDVVKSEKNETDEE